MQHCLPHAAAYDQSKVLLEPFLPIPATNPLGQPWCMHATSAFLSPLGSADVDVVGGARILINVFRSSGRKSLVKLLALPIA